MTMIEKVARAVCRNLKMPEEMWSNEVFLSTARAAIKAMREPTEGMLDAAFDAAGENVPADAWRAMIDVVMKEEEKEVDDRQVRQEEA